MKALEHNLFNLHGDAGKKWLEALPSKIKLLESKYGLSELNPVESLSYNYVLRVLIGESLIKYWLTIKKNMEINSPIF